MSVLVQYEVSPPDPERFIAAGKKFIPLIEAEGGKVVGAYRLENDPSKFTWLEEWESHDVMHKASDKHGEDFNREAGTEGIEWTTKVWTPAL